MSSEGEGNAAGAIGVSKPRPEWVTFLQGERKAAVDRMPPAMRAEYDESRAAARARDERKRELAAQRKKAAAELMRRVYSLLHDGLTGYEVAACVGRSAPGMARFAAARGVAVSLSTLSVRRAVTLSVAGEAALRRAAADYGASAAETVEEALAFLIADDATVLRRLLHIKRREQAAANV